ncbi:hypothetical protein L3Q82_016336, partial [Scortum barcoo]
MQLISRKAAGPDSLSPRVLKGRASQLCGIFQHIFNLSLIQMVVPDRWKTSCLVPVPRKKHPSTHSDYRPVVALTSHVMKSLERLMVRHLRTVVGPSAYTHLEEAGSNVRVTFFDFSINTIQPALLNRKVLDMLVDAPLAAWIHSYLTGRPQYVRLGNITLDSTSCHLQKFSDDSAGHCGLYQQGPGGGVQACGGLNHLQLNVTKMKELVVDFRKQRTRLNSVSIRSTEVDIVDSYNVIFYAAVCWGSRLKTADTNRLNKLIRRAGSVLGVELESVAEVSERRMLRKLLSIMDN